MAVGGDDGMGHKTGELRLARAGAPEPSSTDWVISTVASAPASCAVSVAVEMGSEIGWDRYPLNQEQQQGD